MRRIAAVTMLHVLFVGAATLLPGAAARAADQNPATPGAPAVPAAPPAPAAEAAEPKITVPGAEGDYLRTMHQGIHYRFAIKFIEGIAAKQPRTDPLNKPNLVTQVFFGVRWDGSVSDVVVTDKSGVEAFDQAAVTAIRGDSVRYAPPPPELFGDDGVAHFRWVFARDHRLCGEGAVRRLEAPLAEALPRLFVQGRLKEAMLRRRATSAPDRRTR